METMQKRRSRKSLSGNEVRKVKDTETVPDNVELDFHMPNSFVISLSCDKHATLGSLKPQLWAKALQLPAANHLRDSAHYVFIGVTNDTSEIQLDDSLTVKELDLVAPLLEVSEPKIERDLNRLFNTVGEAIGVQVASIDAQSMRDPDLQELRTLLRHYCHPIAEGREVWTVEELMMFFYPPNLDLNEDLPYCTLNQLKRLPDGMVPVDVYWIEEETNRYEIQVDPTMQPVTVIEEAIRARNRRLGRPETDAKRPLSMAGDIYVVKVCGREEYLLGDYSLHLYKYIRTCINRSTTPVLHLIPRHSLIKSLPDNSCLMLQQNLPEKMSRASHNILSWDIQEKFTIRVNNLLGKVPNANMNIKAHIYNGNQSLCQPFKTRAHGWKQPWRFYIDIQQLPRTARICFTIYTREKNKEVVHFWLNHQIFDHSGHMITGIHKTDTFPQATAGQNTDTICPVLEFEIISPSPKDIYFPSDDIIHSRIEPLLTPETRGQLTGISVNELEEFVSRDMMTPLSVKERQLLWRNRHALLHHNANILPRLVQCVNWTDRHDVAELYALLKVWSCDQLNLTSVLQLLGYEYADTWVRSLAVKRLRCLVRPAQLELYLLQLVQTVKFECYPYNDLSCYLLEMSLTNRRVGHRFFWLLRAEVDDLFPRKLFAPLLEVYCLYCGSSILQSHIADVRCLTKYQDVCRKIKQKTRQDEQGAILKEWLADESTRQTLEQTTATLDPDLMLGQICQEDCKLMLSKMRPLWITWKNRSQLAAEVGKEKIRYIVKKGDDLRQDMLVIQLVKVMDMLWKYGCHDYWLTVYDCMTMGKQLGLIEVVTDAETVCSIHMEKQGIAHSFVGASSLHSWLYENNTGNAYMEAVRRFTYSCAGYCVATYILGIKDRHSDNIMVSKNGQLFHIDFGHIMDHKKTKLGISRERTPFILTEDFIRVVCMGSDNYKKNDYFQEFQFLCFEAYMTIRRHANLFLTLLNLMLHSNLPELKDSADIDYCRRSLALDVPEHEAGQHFLKMFFKSFNGQWKTNVDWFFHRFNRVIK